MERLFIHYYLKTVAKLINKIKEEFYFNFNSSFELNRETKYNIFQCILYLFLVFIVAEETYITKSEDKIIDYCFKYIEHQKTITESYRLTFIIQVKDYLLELSEKEILIKKTRNGKHRYSFNKKYYESIKKEK